MNSWAVRLCGVIALLAGSWTADASPAHLVRDINTVAQGVSSNPGSFLNQGTWALFFASNGSADLPWATNGTAASTVALGTVPVSVGYPPLQVGSKVFLFGEATPGNPNLTSIWVSDGTPAGSHLVADATGNTAWTGGFPLIAFGSKAVFVGANTSNPTSTLWLSDGVNAAVPVPSAGGQAYGTGPAVAANGHIYFLATSGFNTPPQPWISDGTQATTVPLAAVPNAAPDPTAILPSPLVQVGNYLLFIAYTTTSGRELWRIDTTTNAVSQVTDIAPGTASGVLDMHIGVLGNAAVFTAAADGTTAALWRSDGTAAGTYSIASVKPDSNRFPNYVGTPGNARLLFWVAVTNGDQLWSTDGTAAGTVQLPVSNPSVDQAWQVGSNFYGYALTGSLEVVWRSDGTVAGTQTLAGIPASTTFKDLPVGDDSVVYVRGAGATTNSVYAYSPSAGTTSTIGTYTQLLGLVGGLWGYRQGVLYFDNEDPADGREPWVSDGTTAGTHLLLNIAPETQTRPSDPSAFAEFNSLLYFAADDGIHGNELWRSDGSSAGTQLVADLNPGAAASNPTNLFVAAGTLYFFATDASGNSQFWRSDGTAAGTVALAPVAPLSPIGCAAGGVAVGGTVYFPGSDPVYGSQLWKTDGTAAGTMRVSDISPPGTVCNLAGFSGRVWFAAGGGGEGDNYLWTSDGTQAGTQPFKDAAGDTLVSPGEYVQIGQLLYFWASYETLLGQLWQTDGTPAGTHAAQPFTTAQVQVLGIAGPVAGQIVVAIETNGGSGQFWVVSPNFTSPVQLGPQLGLARVYANNNVAFLYGQAGTTGNISAQLWASDGTPGGTQDMFQGQLAVVPGTFSDFRGQTMFQLGNGAGASWIRTDGTSANTFATLAVSAASGWGEAGQNFFFVGNDSTNGNELWAITNDPPVAAADDLGTVVSSQSVTYDVLANDKDDDGSLNPASLTIVTQPTGGTVTVGAAGSVTYTARAGFTGSDSFTYTVADMQGAVSQAATVTVSVVAASTGGGGGAGKGGGGGGSVSPEMLLLLAALAFQAALRRRSTIRGSRSPM